MDHKPASSSRAHQSAAKETNFSMPRWSTGQPGAVRDVDHGGEGPSKSGHVRAWKVDWFSTAAMVPGWAEYADEPEDRRHKAPDRCSTPFEALEAGRRWRSRRAAATMASGVVQREPCARS
jgi:hypothetical protein